MLPCTLRTFGSGLPRSRAGTMGPRPGSGLLSEERGLAGCLDILLGGLFLGASLPLPSGACLRRSRTWSRPGSRGLSSPCIGPALSLDAVVPGPVAERAQVISDGWLRPRQVLAQGGGRVPMLLVRISGAVC